MILLLLHSIFEFLLERNICKVRTNKQNKHQIKTYHIHVISRIESCQNLTNRFFSPKMFWNLNATL